MDELTNKFQELPTEAQYVIMGAGALIGILLIILVIAVILSATKSSSNEAAPEKVRMPKRLPIAPIPIMTDREHALYRVLLATMTEFPDYEVHAKVSTTAMLGARDEEHPKVASAIHKKLVRESHDFIIIDKERYPIAVIELDSGDNDEREEQARQAGLPIIRVKNPHVDPREMVKRFKTLFQ